MHWHSKRTSTLVLAILMALLLAPAAAGTAIESSSEPERLAVSDTAFEACQDTLRALGAEFEIVDPVTSEDPQCGIIRPVQLVQVVRGVELVPAGPMRCETALALARWAEDFVVPASRLLPDRGLLTGLVQSSTYVCRRRNNLPTGKLSEHAFGNAVDIREFRFAEGAALPVQPREGQGSVAESFQRAVRSSACLTFTTVIGPGTDAAHADHLHLDIKARSRGFRLCQ